MCTSPVPTCGKQSTMLRRRRRAAFTPIDLLTVLVVIVLAILLLLPAVRSQRTQTRTTLCMSRVGQLCKATLMYADDYDEVPPFVGRGWEDCDDAERLAKEVWPKGSGKTLGQWAAAETWLMPKMPTFWLKPQAEWPKDAGVRNGTLFPYSRFENLYRCPEFERIAPKKKSQNVFNFTRSILGRMWLHKAEKDSKLGPQWVTSPASDNWCGQAGPILKTSQVYAPSQLQMLLDEQWDRHCAAPKEQFQKAGGGMLAGVIQEQWMAADCVFGVWGNEIGQYHGSKLPCQTVPEAARDQVPAVKRGSAAFYDGHVELELDPLPGRTLTLPKADAVKALKDFVDRHLHAQRGLSLKVAKFDWAKVWP